MVKAIRTVRAGGKDGDYFKVLPICICHEHKAFPREQKIMKEKIKIFLGVLLATIKKNPKLSIGVGIGGKLSCLNEKLCIMEK